MTLSTVFLFFLFFIFPFFICSSSYYLLYSFLSFIVLLVFCSVRIITRLPLSLSLPLFLFILPISLGLSPLSSSSLSLSVSLPCPPPYPSRPHFLVLLPIPLGPSSSSPALQHVPHPGHLPLQPAEFEVEARVVGVGAPQRGPQLGQVVLVAASVGPHVLLLRLRLLLQGLQGVVRCARLREELRLKEGCLLDVGMQSVPQYVLYRHFNVD